MAAAQTGTGKTAGFTLPILHRCEGRRAQPNRCRALIVTPTRELAAQIQDNVTQYSKYLPLKSEVVFGGVKINPQMQKLRGGVDVLVATLDVFWICMAKTPFDSTTSKSWYSMKPTGCSTWDLSTTSERSSDCCHQNVRTCFTRPPSHLKFENWPNPWSTIPSKFRSRHPTPRSNGLSKRSSL